MIARVPLTALLRSRSGTSAVEFALVAPILLMMMFSILVYGLYFGAAHALQQIAAEAARSSVAGLGDEERATIARETVTRSVAGSILLRPEDVSVTLGDDPADPDVYVVTLTFDARHSGFASVAGLIPLPSTFLTRSMRVRRGGS